MKNTEKSRRNVLKDQWNVDIDSLIKCCEEINECIEYTMQNYRLGDTASKLYHHILDYKGDKFTDKFIALVRETLTAWNMDNYRGAKMKDVSHFHDVFVTNKHIWTPWLNLKFEDWAIVGSINEQYVRQVWNMLKLSANKSSLVTNAKTLHFFFPDLCIPIDRKFTINFFTGGYDVPADTDPLQVEWYISIHRVLCRFYLKHRVCFDNLSKVLNLPIPKLLDNMIIGYILLREKYTKEFDLATYLNKCTKCKK